MAHSNRDNTLRVTLSGMLLAPRTVVIPYSRSTGRFSSSGRYRATGRRSMMGRVSVLPSQWARRFISSITNWIRMAE